jgi:ribosome-binding protein aMBF1 (putative translation factor)
MRLFNINFLKNKKIILEEQNNSKKYDQYVELGKLVKEARIQNNLSVKELSNISKIPESSINSIENNIEDLDQEILF